MAVEREQLRAGGLRGADLRIAFAAEREDGVEVGEGFDVVDDGGLAVEALIHGKGGRVRTSGRRPSMLASRAVSSPQM
jgi:hypothetical protein